MKAFEWCGVHAGVLFLLAKADSSWELSLDTGAEAWERHENLYVTLLELGNLSL